MGSSERRIPPRMSIFKTYRQVRLRKGKSVPEWLTQALRLRNALNASPGWAFTESARVMDPGSVSCRPDSEKGAATGCERTGKATGFILPFPRRRACALQGGKTATPTCSQKESLARGRGFCRISGHCSPGRTFQTRQGAMAC